MTAKTESGTTTTFSYSNSSWKDELTAVNGTSLTYDENGNVLTYGNKKFTWNTGRNLESIVDGNNKYSYTYDENGIRTSKTVNGKTTYYNTKDGVILSQTDGTDTLYFQYDSNGTPLGFVWNGTQYLYLTNQMGDVISITDANGKIVGNYEYDAWGKVLTADSSIAQQNPLRYRGYYYDNETSYYYLQSRYYDSNICRFINADIAEILNVTKDSKSGLSLFVYCYNNPVNQKDSDGYWVGFYPKFNSVEAFSKANYATLNMMWVDVAYKRTGMNGKCLGVTLNIGAGISFGCVVSGKTKLCVIYHKNSQSKIKSLLTLKNIKKINIRFKRR